MKTALDRIVMIGQECPDCRRTFGLDRRNGKTLEEAAEEYAASNKCPTCIEPAPAPAEMPADAAPVAGAQ